MGRPNWLARIEHATHLVSNVGWLCLLCCRPSRHPEIAAITLAPCALRHSIQLAEEVLHVLMGALGDGRAEQRQRYSATCAHMSRLARSSMSLGDPPAPNAAAVILKKIWRVVSIARGYQHAEGGLQV